MQEEDDGRISVGSFIVWCSPLKEVTDSSGVSAILSTSPDHQLENLALNQLVTVTEF